MSAAEANIPKYKAIAAESFPEFGPKEVDQYISNFNLFDSDGNGSIDADELAQILKNLDMSASPADVAAMIKVCLHCPVCMDIALLRPAAPGRAARRGGGRGGGRRSKRFFFRLLSFPHTN